MGLTSVPGPVVGEGAASNGGDADRSCERVLYESTLPSSTCISLWGVRDVEGGDRGLSYKDG